jgi:hypothetical protein
MYGCTIVTLDYLDQPPDNIKLVASTIYGIHQNGGYFALRHRACTHCQVFLIYWDWYYMHTITYKVEYVSIASSCIYYEFELISQLLLPKNILIRVVVMLYVVACCVCLIYLYLIYVLTSSYVSLFVYLWHVQRSFNNSPRSVIG